MKVILYNAISLDGIVARKDGREDFISNETWLETCRLSKKVKCLILSRKAYGAIMSWKFDMSSFENVTKIIVSKEQKIKLNQGEIYAGSPKAALKIAKSMGFKEVLFSAGEKLNNVFLKENLIDEMIINVEPIIVGEGIRIFSNKFNKRLRLVKTKKLKKGIIQLYYNIVK